MKLHVYTSCILFAIVNTATRVVKNQDEISFQLKVTFLFTVNNFRVLHLLLSLIEVVGG
jgi:hypothetical protein